VRPGVPRLGHEVLQICVWAPRGQSRDWGGGDVRMCVNGDRCGKELRVHWAVCAHLKPLLKTFLLCGRGLLSVALKKPTGGKRRKARRESDLMKDVTVGTIYSSQLLRRQHSLRSTQRTGRSISQTLDKFDFKRRVWRCHVVHRAQIILRGGLGCGSLRCLAEHRRVRADACQAKRVPGTPIWRRAAHRPCTWLQSWHTIVAPVLSRRTRGAAIACMRGTVRKTVRLGTESHRMYAGAYPLAHHCTKLPPHNPASSGPFALSASPGRARPPRHGPCRDPVCATTQGHTTCEPLAWAHLTW
jgi:hypothetical protein